MMVRRHTYTKEQRDFIEKNVHGLMNSGLAELFNAKFDTNVTSGQISAYKGNHGLISNLDTTFKKGLKPFNKGMKQSDYMTKESIEKTKNTRFKKGDIPKSTRPVGSERICSKDGYILIKTKEPRSWRLKHRVIWEQEHGPIPPGYIVKFLDGNKLNLELDNLVLIHRSQNAVINKQGLLSNEPEVAKTGILISEVMLKASKLSKR